MLTISSTVTSGDVAGSSNPAPDDDEASDWVQRTCTFNHNEDAERDCALFPMPLEFLRISWPVGLVAIPFGTVYWLLLFLLPDSIDAYVHMRAYTDFSRWGGIEILFALNSGILGWLSVVIVERRADVARFVLLLMVLPWCFSSIGSGFALASLSVGVFSDAVWNMLMYSLVSTVGASALRAYLSDIL